MERRVLRLGIDSDPAAALLRLPLREVDDLLERRNLELPVELGWASATGLLRAEGLDLGQREVGGEEACRRKAVKHLGRLAACELGMVRNVGRIAGRGIRVADERLVTGDQHAVVRRHEVGLDVVCAELDREPVGLQRVLGQEAARSPVADHQRAVLALRAVALVLVLADGGRRCEERHHSEQDQGQANPRRARAHRPKLTDRPAQRYVDRMRASARVAQAGAAIGGPTIVISGIGRSAHAAAGLRRPRRRCAPSGARTPRVCRPAGSARPRRGDWPACAGRCAARRRPRLRPWSRARP